MKTITNLSLCLSVAALSVSCAFNYTLPPDTGTPTTQPSTITFDNRIKVSAIDGTPFIANSSIWVRGSHTVSLAPGSHTFKVRYNAVSMRGGIYTDDDVVIRGELVSGKRYEITSETIAGKMSFKVTEEK